MVHKLRKVNKILRLAEREGFYLALNPKDLRLDFQALPILALIFPVLLEILNCPSGSRFGSRNLNIEQFPLQSPEPHSCEFLFGRPQFFRTLGITFEDFCNGFTLTLNVTRWGSVYVINSRESGCRARINPLEKF